jgi:hypothetical protein
VRPRAVLDAVVKSVSNFMENEIYEDPHYAVSYLQVFRPKFRMHFSYFPCVLHAPPISSSFN